MSDPGVGRGRVVTPVTARGHHGPGTQQRVNCGYSVTLLGARILFVATELPIRYSRPLQLSSYTSVNRSGVLLSQPVFVLRPVDLFQYLNAMLSAYV